jgi:hypothetical protein
MARTSHRTWWRVIAGVLAYALAVQGFVFALDLDQPAIAAANGTAFVSFELCSHGGGGSATVPGVPSQAPVGELHCLFCVGGAVYVNCAPPCAPLWSKIVLIDAAWTSTPGRLVALFVNESAWPRGPPAAA